MSKPLTLMAIHAHPDDEASSTGGVLAKYAAEGHTTVLVTCTGGEVGEISDAALATPERLAEVRRRELDESVRILNVTHLELLGYRDSGMMGTEDNTHPDAFAQADLDAAAGRLVALVRRYRPSVLVTYDENGFYGHPDHINANRIAVKAYEWAGDPARFPEHGLEPWAPFKLYYQAIPRSTMASFSRRLREFGIEPPMPEEGDTERMPWGTPDELVTTTVDVSAYIDQKRQALFAHATQMGPEQFFVKLPTEIFDEVFGQEGYQLVNARVPAAPPEADLFAGLC